MDGTVTVARRNGHGNVSETKDLFRKLRNVLDPEYIMQDAQSASRLGALEFFPKVTFLMCYFHVKKNVCCFKSIF